MHFGCVTRPPTSYLALLAITIINGLPSYNLIFQLLRSVAITVVLKLSSAVSFGDQM